MERSQRSSFGMTHQKNETEKAQKAHSKHPNDSKNVSNPHHRAKPSSARANIAFSKILSTYSDSYLSKYRDITKLKKKEDKASLVPQISRNSRFVQKIDTEEFAEHLERLEDEYERFIKA